MSYLEERRKYIEAGRPLKEKKKYIIPKQSAKRKKQLEANKALVGKDGDSFKEAWFKARRKQMTGFCACGCGKPSSKNDFIDLSGKIQSHFRSSCCHIFPQRIFESIQFHPLNWVERAFWGGCHSQMDDTSMDRWVNFADWENIKEKFHELAPLLTDEERATKFYIQLEKLVYVR